MIAMVDDASDLIDIRVENPWSEETAPAFLNIPIGSIWNAETEVKDGPGDIGSFETEVEWDVWLTVSNPDVLRDLAAHLEEKADELEAVYEEFGMEAPNGVLEHREEVDSDA